MAPGRKRRKITAKPTTVAVNEPQCQVVITEDAHSDPLERQAKNILSAVIKARLANRKELYQQIKELCHVEDGLFGRQDLLQLFPQEIWEMIMKSLNVVHLANCSRACESFKTIINSPDQEILFAKVLPILFPYIPLIGPDEERHYRHIGIRELVNCGRVCKKWRAGVDCFAKSYFCIKNPPSCSMDKLVKDPVQNFDDKNMLWVKSRYDVWNRTPNGADAWYFRLQEVKYDIQFKIGTNPFLTHLSVRLSEILNPSPIRTLKGNVIWHLDLEINRVKVYTSKHVYSLCAKALQKCPNLKGLCLSKCTWTSPNEKILQNGTVGKIIHPQLESLEVTFENKDVLQVQDGLVANFSSQLKRVQVRYWNTNLYHTLDWNNLVDLEILEGNSFELLASLEIMTAPQLFKLHVRLDYTCKDLSVFFKCINNFPNLQHLSVMLTNLFSVQLRQKILGLPLDQVTSNCITTLEVVCKNLDEAREFPLLFPLVRNLIYRYGNRDKELKNSFSEFIAENVYSTNAKQIIQIYKNMNMSSIWTLLPWLETQELDCKGVSLPKKNTYYKKDTVNITRKFTRVGYVWETDKYKLGHEMQLVKVRAEVTQKLRKRLQEERYQINRKLLKTTPKSIKLRDRIFPFIIPKLDREDIFACRRVCKAWWKLVGERIFDNNKHNIIYNFKVPSNAKTERAKFKAYVKKNRTTPFFARNVELTLDPNIDGLKFLLNAVGEHIQILTLSAEKSLVPTLVDAYQICVGCINNCPNLRSFSLNIPVLKWSDEKFYMQLKEKHPLEKPKHLEHLSTCEPVEDYDAPLNKLVKDLELAFHLQLKTLTQPDCQQHSASRLNRDTQFTKLKEYTITNFDPERASSEYYWQMHCKCLEKVSLIINAPGMAIDTIKGIAKLWPNLRVLELQFGPKFIGLNRNIVYSNPQIIMPVVQVIVMLDYKHQVSLDFLVHFPFVKKLCIQYGKLAGSENEKKIVHQNIIYSNSNMLTEIPMRWPERDFIQLMRYLKDEKKQYDELCIHASNIWSVLRRLQTIEITYCPAGSEKDVRTFHRK